MRQTVRLTQPTQRVPLNRSNPLTLGMRRCFSAVHGALDPATEQLWPTAVNVTSPRAMGPTGQHLLDTNGGSYVSALQALPAAGWTIAAVYMPINGTSTSIVGFCEAPGNITFDRALRSTSGYQAYLSDGGSKTSSGIGTVVANQRAHIVARCDAAFKLQCCYNGVFDTATACANNGHTGYATPEFCVGNSNNAQAIAQGYALVCYWDRALTNGEILSWCANPWQIFRSFGNIWFAGVPAGGGGSFTLTAAQGSYALTGQAAGFNTAQTSAQGAYSLTGQDAALSVSANLSMTAAPGAYALSGQPAVFGITQTAAPGSYTLTGQNILLTLSGNYSMAAAQGAYALSGQDATFASTLNMGGAQGVYALSGQPVSFAISANLLLTAAQGAYALTGQDAAFSFTASLTMPAGQGAYVLTGQPATFSGLIVMTGEQGAYALSGQDAHFTVGARIDAAQGSYLLSGQDAWVVVDRYQLNTLMEGNSVVDLGFGQPGVRYATLSFWVKSSKTGTYCVALRNGPKNRSYVAEYEITAANAWEYKAISFAVDATGTWLYDNGLGLLITWSLAGGSARADAQVWTQGNFTITANQVNLLETVGNTFALDLIQLLATRRAAPYQWQSHQEVLAECEHWRTEFH